MADIISYTVPVGGENTTYYFGDEQLQDRVQDLKDYTGMDFYDDDVIGIEVDFDNNIFTRLSAGIGKNGGSDFNVFPTYAGMRRCVLADDGTVVAYYGEQGYVEDGSTGQVMVEIPKFYYRMIPLSLEPIVEEVTENNVTTTIMHEGYHIRKARYYISTNPHDGFKVHPLFVNENGQEVEQAYISAYEGSLYDVSESKYVLEDEQTVDVTSDKFCSVAIPHTHSFDGTEVLVHGVKPASGTSQLLTRANVEAVCKNRGTGWHSFNTKAHSAVMIMFMVEYATLNVQGTIGKGVTYFAGSMLNNSSYTGSTSNLGSSSGQATSTISSTGVAETVNGKTAVSYRGVENFWGNMWKYIIDINISGDGGQRGGIPYICSDFNYDENKNTGNYKSVGFSVVNWNTLNHSQSYGYISAFGYGNPDYDWLFVPSEIGNNGASSTLPVGDYAFVTSNLNGYMIPFLGGVWSYEDAAGSFCWFMHYDSDTYLGIVGGRLMYIPTGGE